MGMQSQAADEPAQDARSWDKLDMGGEGTLVT